MIENFCILKTLLTCEVQIIIVRCFDCKHYSIFEMVLIKQLMFIYCIEVNYDKDDSHFLSTQDIITEKMDRKIVVRHFLNDTPESCCCIYPLHLIVVILIAWLQLKEGPSFLLHCSFKMT